MSTIQRLTLLALVLSVLAFAACDMIGPEPGPEPSGYVIESYQIAGEPIGTVAVRRTAGLDTVYHSAPTGVSGADVRIIWLSDNAEAPDTIEFKEDPEEPGRYHPTSESRVRPLTRYRLTVTPPGGGPLITAETVVPDTFRVTGSVEDTVRFGRGEALSFRATASRYPGRQGIYLLHLKALDARESQLTPPAKKLLEGVETDLDKKGGYSLKDMRRAEWGPINEASFRASPDEGSGDKASTRGVTVTVAWEKIAFYGPNRIDAYVIDDNLYDIIRSDAAQESSAAPGDIPPVVDHVENAAGVFAGIARVRYNAYVRRP